MEEKKKSNGGLIALVVILLLACVGMGAFIYINKDKLTAKENTIESTQNEKESVETVEKEPVKEETNTIETRKCTGIYSGTAALTQDVQTKEYGKGTLTIELKSDGTYELKKENMNGATGSYTIIENALLLKTSPEITGPGVDTSAKYSQYLHINDDCSAISWGYGSYFFDPSFTLTRIN